VPTRGSLFVPRLPGPPTAPKSVTIDPNGLPPSSTLLYAGERIFMRHHDMWASAFGLGTGSSGEFGSAGHHPMQDLTNRLLRKTVLGNLVHEGSRQGCTPGPDPTLKSKRLAARHYYQLGQMSPV
jgi:hypothetical protein